MKKILLILAFAISFGTSYGQSNKELAGVYIKKAKKNYSNLEIDLAAKNFTKAIRLLDTIVKSDIARLGTLIQFELRAYENAKSYAKQYFALVKNKTSEEYSQLLDLYVTIEEELERVEIENARKEKERLAREKETRRIDSLKNVWKLKADGMSLNIASIQKFNKNGIAVFKKNADYGIINDVGEILVKAENYKVAKSFDGFVLLQDKEKEPTKIYCFNTNTKSGFVLPSVSEFNTLSTHYGNVMMPRGNGTIVAYPNNSLKMYIYNVVSRKFLNISDERTLFKELKKTDKIDNYNKDGQVKINKKWFSLGGHLGGGVYALYLSDYSIYGFLCSLDGSILKTNNYQGIGSFYNGKFYVENSDDSSYWVNQNGTKVTSATDDNGSYSGVSKIVTLDTGAFQIHQTISGKIYIVLGTEKLETLEDFLRKHP